MKILNSVLTHLFGNKVTVVHLSRLHAFCRFETKLILNGSEPILSVQAVSHGKHIESVKTFRTKKLEAPKIGEYRILEKEHVTQFYDD